MPENETYLETIARAIEASKQVNESMNRSIAELQTSIDKMGEAYQQVLEIAKEVKTDEFRMIKPKKAISCPRCQGTGMIPALDNAPWVMKPCAKCNGTGEIEDE